MAAVPISVVVAVRDGARYLADSLRTVLDQQGPAFEVIVIDDGSTDATPAILAGLARADGRLVVRRASAQGLTASLAQGIAQASGTYVARHDADDVSLPGRFERQMTYLEQHPDVAAIGSAAGVIDERGAPVGPFPTAHGAAAVRHGLLTLRATPVHGSMMIRRTALAAAGGYRLAFPAAQDYDLWLRLAERFEIDVLPDVLYRWRLNPSGVYGQRRRQQLQYAGVARTFARERERYAEDSYRQLEACAGDLDRFASRYRLAGPLHALWGELLYRGLDDPSIARAHLWRAVRLGAIGPKTLALLAWAALGLSWPGGRPMAAATP
jgi:glycosyltransferase involved in cell wall biosynthesis